MEPSSLLSTLLQYTVSIGAVLLLFGGTVMIHELGHFLTAKWFGLRIDAFSIGMGPALWKKTVNGIVYKIGLLPIGGYVALPQMDITGSAFEHEDAKEGKLQEVAPWKRIVIAVAGPLMNVLAALVLCTIVWWQGKPADPGPGPAVIGSVAESSPAYEAGLREGDRIRMVNDDKIHFWADVQISAMLNESLDAQVIRDGEILRLYNIPTELGPLGHRRLEGVGPVEDDLLYIEVAEVMPDSPAQRAGVQEGDRLVSVNDEPVKGGRHFAEMVRASEGQEIDLTVQRDGNGEQVHLTLSPEMDEETDRWLIGILMQGEFELAHPRPLRQIHYFAGSIFRTLKAFTRPQEIGKAAKGVGGPVMILSGMHSQVQFHPMQALWFTALINVNLAIINLLPLIILDGGHIMVALFEWITGKKPYRSLIVGLANAMVVILILLMVLLSFRDVKLLQRINERMSSDVPEQEAPSGTPEE